MKHERLYLAVAKGVEKALRQLDFDDEQEQCRGNEILRRLNALGAKLVYMEVNGDRLG